MVRDGIALRINSEPDLQVCGEAAAGIEALEKLSALQPDVVVVDIALPGHDGIDLIKQIHALHPKYHMLVFSAHDESVYAERALWAGAQGYVMKSEPSANLLAAIRQVVNGEIVVGRKMTNQIMHRVAANRNSMSPSVVNVLSDRELEVFTLIGEGKGRNEIARQLKISVKTFEVHRAHIRKKLGRRTAQELYQLAFQMLQSGDIGSRSQPAHPPIHNS